MFGKRKKGGDERLEGRRECETRKRRARKGMRGEGRRGGRRENGGD